MASILLLVFILQVVIHIINKAGVGTINNFLWLLYNKLPTPTSNASRQQVKLKQEVLRLKKELAGVSAQDDFAKWAKLRRQHDKVMADYEKSEKTIGSSKASFDSKANLVRWVSTSGLRLFIQFWFARQALFWIPPGWLPGYVEWILSFPKAPKGSISVQIWAAACTTVIQIASDAMISAYTLTVGEKSGMSAQIPQAFSRKEVQSTSGSKGSRERKEL
ncbi:hypothetical protein M501DRAFT_930254 [Patellaria atrata CBS 101060]|uniref:Guided entry of tail-anchored proteins 1 n=1 Tax=Patellaria atrata CBS 101060 TaxID=1346257 RepID=A0A9P4SD91_9PEZI|nr:hypothetical protein M501DRAFT_930254 [Patellaria atrata CBS 101060]